MTNDTIDNDKDWFRSLTPYQIGKIGEILRPAQLAPFLSVVHRIAEEDQARKEKQK